MKNELFDSNKRTIAYSWILSRAFDRVHALCLPNLKPDDNESTKEVAFDTSDRQLILGMRLLAGLLKPMYDDEFKKGFNELVKQNTEVDEAGYKLVDKFNFWIDVYGLLMELCDRKGLLPAEDTEEEALLVG